MTNRKKIAAGVIWNFAEQLWRRGIAVAITLLLAYFLAPEDFGLLAIVTVFVAIANTLMDSGFKEAIIRMPEPSNSDFSTAFYANIALGLTSYLLVYFSAPHIADFYREPRLVALIHVAGLSILANALQIVPSAILIRRLDFKAQFKVTVPATVISSVAAVTLAVLGFGVWALVIQMLLSAFLITVLLWRMRLWRPSGLFCMHSLRSMYGFGCKLFLSGLLEIAFSNMYVAIIAKLFAGTVVGLYFFAEKIRDMLVTQLVNSIQTVTYPALSAFQDDAGRLKSSYRNVISVTTFLVFPTMLFTAALAEPIFRTFLPERWWAGASYLQLMCIAGCLYPLHAINLNILKVKGRSDLFLYIEIIKKVMAAVILIVSIPFGIVGILLGQIISSILGYIPNSYFSSKLIDYPPLEQIADFLPSLVLSGVLALGVYGCTILLGWSNLVKLLTLSVAAPAIYLGIANLMHMEGYRIMRNTLTGLIATKKENSRVNQP
jgi:O-antigen/teichoic acid export membrane protein